MSRIALALLVVCSSFALAQPSQEPTSGGPAIEDVVMPLLVSAELAAGQGRPELALARAEVLLAVLPSGSSLSVRANGVRMVAINALGGGAPPQVDPQETLSPLVTQAEEDARQGALELARARLEIVLRYVPDGTPLAVRVRGLQAALQPQPAQPVPPPPVEPTRVGVPPPSWGPPVQMAPRPMTEQRPRDPYARGTGELIELYITMSAFGIYTGIYIPYVAGLNQCFGLRPGDAIPPACPTRIERTSGMLEIDDNALNAAFVFPSLIGGGLFALAVGGMDAIGLRTGVGPSISVGLRYGTVSGFLLWGTMGSTTLNDREHLAVGWVSALTGGVIGAVMGYGTQPSTDQVRFVETGGLWGAGLGLLLGTTIAGWDDTFDRDDDELIVGMTLGGMWSALLVNSILAGVGTSVSAARGWALTLGFATGAAAGTLVPLIVSSFSQTFSPAIFGGVASGTSIVGLIIAYLITEGMAARAAAPPPIALGIAPLDGGGALSVSGAF